jgi:hypothetical protein
MSSSSSLRSTAEHAGEDDDDISVSTQGPPPAGRFIRSPTSGNRPPPPSGPLSLLRKNAKTLINVARAVRPRVPPPWSFEARDVPCLDRDDMPLVATFSCGGVVTDESLGPRAQRQCEKAIVDAIRQHCTSALRCADNKDAHHDFSRDEVCK